MVNAEENLACLVFKYPILVYEKIFGDFQTHENKKHELGNIDESYLALQYNVHQNYLTS